MLSPIIGNYLLCAQLLIRDYQAEIIDVNSTNGVNIIATTNQTKIALSVYTTRLTSAYIYKFSLQNINWPQDRNCFNACILIPSSEEINQKRPLFYFSPRNDSATNMDIDTQSSLCNNWTILQSNSIV